MRPTRCSTCRWSEIHLLRTQDGAYVVHVCGHSILPGEVPLPRVSVVRSPFEVVELLTVRGGRTAPYLSVPGARVLARAADVDEGIRDAYINRAVA